VVGCNPWQFDYPAGEIVTVIDPYLFSFAPSGVPVVPYVSGGMATRLNDLIEPAAAIHNRDNTLLDGDLTVTSANHADSFAWTKSGNGSFTAYPDSFFVKNVSKTVNLLACQSSTLAVQVYGANLTMQDLPTSAPVAQGRIWVDGSGYVRAVL
jgi:hypothetical protein